MKVSAVLVVFAAVAVGAISANFVTYPEIARELAGSRIVSGWEAEDGQFPFQLSLRMVSPIGAVSSCGASIIHEQWGLTAAHCTAGRISFVLRAGVVNLTRPQAIFETTVFYNHPLYNNNLPSLVQPHDIGLLRFGRTLIFNDLVQPIRLQRSEAMDENYEGVRLTASGWGRTWTNGQSSENLNWVYLRGDTNERCWRQYGSIIVSSTICASGYNDTTQSTCQGDSGGPLTVIDVDEEFSQVGVTSFVSGTGCHTGFPAGFIRPGHYHAWFTEVTGIDFDWVPEPVPTDAPETTTSAPEATTSAPEATTSAPEATTSAPEATTSAPEATTSAPETTTSAPEATTSAPEATTSAPEATTSAPEATTSAPEATTSAPEATTSAPEATTSAPEATTSAPEATTSAPEATTSAPEATTSAPEVWDPECEEEEVYTVHVVNN